MIDELEHLCAFRADEPPPSEATIAAARASLSELIRRSGSRVPTPTTNKPSARAGRRRALRRTWRVRLAIAAAAGCIAIVIAGVLGSPTATAPPAALATALEQLARVAESRAWTGTPGPGQYLYTRSQSLSEIDAIASGRECVVMVDQHREIWIAANGAGAIRETDNHGRFTSAADRATCQLVHITNPATQDSSGFQRFGPGGLGFPTTNWHALSTDPKTLLVQLRKLDGGPRTAAEDFVHIGDFLRESDAPPTIRAALYRAAALIPGVRLLGPTHDRVGRPGLGVVFTAHGRPTDELIFDQKTSALLSETYFAPSGKAAGWSVYLESRIVDSLPKR